MLFPTHHSVTYVPIFFYILIVYTVLSQAINKTLFLRYLMRHNVVINESRRNRNNNNNKHSYDITHKVGKETIFIGKRFQSIKNATNQIDDQSNVEDLDDEIIHADLITNFLKIIEDYQENADQCIAGTEYTLSSNIVYKYEEEKYKSECMLAVNHANLLTRLWKYGSVSLLSSDYLFYSLVRNMLESDENITSAGNCYMEFEFKNYELFCPFAVRLDSGEILVKDLSIKYKYTNQKSEWFFKSKERAEKIIQAAYQTKNGSTIMRTSSMNEGNKVKLFSESIIYVGYEDGYWSKPYFDCGGANKWMMTYTVPFFDFKKNEYYFKGTSGIDIDLRKVDINQCDDGEKNAGNNIFADSHKCDRLSTYCEHVTGKGFRRGSYRCVCKPKFYHATPILNRHYFQGVFVEEEFEKFSKNQPNVYSELRCKPCPADCNECTSYKPCSLQYNFQFRTILLLLHCCIMLGLIPLFIYTIRNRTLPIIKAASPSMLYTILIGAFFLYIEIIAIYPKPTIITCNLDFFARKLGFSILYGSLILKTWRISIVFRIRSAQRVSLSDRLVLKKLGFIVMAFTTVAILRINISPILVNTVINFENLRAHYCTYNWWDYTMNTLELAVLLVGIKISFDVRKTPSQFNESKFVTWAIYNETIMSSFLMIIIYFLKKYGYPDLLFMVRFIHNHVTTTFVLLLLFGFKMYVIQKKGSANEKKIVINKVNRPKKSFLEMQKLFFSTKDSVKFTDKDIQNELERLYAALEFMTNAHLRSENFHLNHKSYDIVLKNKKGISLAKESSSMNSIREDDVKQCLLNLIRK